MKRKVTKLRLSPNEEARIIREEHERRRKLRLLQVREQQRYIAQQIRREVEQRRQDELRQLEEELREVWELQQREKLHTLQRLYQESLQLLGQGHQSAKENEPDLAAIAQREEENQAKAEERYREALKELKTQKLKEHERQNKSVNARKKVLQAEKERSAKVASLPPPPPNPIQNIDSKKPHVVKKLDVSAFAATHYHMHESTVQREAETNETNAHEEAELEARRLRDLQREAKRRREEQLEKARLRGRQALRREQLVQDRERLLVELEHMQQTDLLRRRQQVSLMPSQIFQPLYTKQETREEFQREMEFGFEDMYTGERRVKGDLVVQLVPEPLPALSNDSQDQELDVTVDEMVTPESENNMQLDTEDGSTEEETSAQMEPSRPAPKLALKKLLDRIRGQRNEWIHRTSHDLAADSPTVFTDQTPERDTTIETGSLPSEERDKRIPAGLREPALLTPAVEPIKQPGAPDPIQADVLSSRIQEYEDERKKREDELEREKQHQMFLLQELEEQKSKLEQMLLEAQQEREHLKAAVTQEVPSNQPDGPACDQEVTSISPDVTSVPVPPPGEDDHTRRIREYQQRLLQQNRVHQRSVEVARQRLEEYQRALRLRYMTSRSLMPAVVPPGLAQPPLHSPSSEHLPVALQLPTTVPAYIHNRPPSVEVSTRDSNTSASPCCPASSVSVGSKLLSDESVSSMLGIQKRDLTTQLTDRILERVTEHLPERLRPSSFNKEQLPYNLFTPCNSTSNPHQPASGRFGAIRSCIADGQPIYSGLQSGSLSSSKEDAQRRELQEAQRRELQEAQRRELQEAQRRELQEAQRRELQEAQRRELQEAQRRELEQREMVAFQRRLQEDERRRQEEQRWRQEVEIEQMKRQKETLQALIETSEQPVSHSPSEVLQSEDIGQKRLQLLASLLKAIEESNGGSLSHLEDSEERENSPEQMQSNCSRTGPAAESSLPTGLPPPSGVFLHPRALKPPVTHVKLGFREMMTEQHELSAIQEVETPVNTTQSSLLPESDCLSSTTISTGSYITTDPEQNGNADTSLDLKHHLEKESGADLSNASSPCGQSFSFGGSSAAGPPADSVDSVFDDSSIQHIIDKYTKELDISLNSTGRITGSEGSNVEEHDPSVSEHCLVQVSERSMVDESSSAHHTPLSLTARAQRSGPVSDSTFMRLHGAVSPVLEPFSGSEGQELDSFRPLIGQLVDQSSCLVVDQKDSAMEQLVGQPSAHSSIIGHLPQPPASLNSDPGGWDSTLSRMIGRLSHQSSSHWLSAGQDFYAGNVVSEPSRLTETAEESRMRPLVGELDESVGHLTRSSGERSPGVLGVSAEGSVPSNLMLPPQVSSPQLSVPDVNPQNQEQQNQTSTVEVGSQRAEGIDFQHYASSMFVGSDSFHPLLAEVTHNETADPSMMFHLPEHGAANSPDGHPASEECSISTPSVDSDTHEDPSVESEPSPERLRTEEPSSCTASGALPDSFSQLIISDCHPNESVFVLSHTMKPDPKQMSLNLSDLTMCDNTPVLDASEMDNSKGDSVLLSYPHAGEIKSTRDEDLGEPLSVSDKISEAAGEKGILEQSGITLVSLTDTTLQERTVTEEKSVHEEELPERFSKDGKEKQMEGFESTPTPEETPDYDSPAHPVSVLEFQWGPGRGLQEVSEQRRRALLQRSNRRVEEIKAKGAGGRGQCDSKAPSKGSKKAAAKGVRSVTCKTKTKAELPRETDDKSKKGHTEQQISQLPSPGTDTCLKNVDEVKMCTPDQRKRNVSEMHQRTRRLYEQLDEVKQQRAIRSRQEDYAKNRLKAKEFHKKTLQKLRAKQVHQSSATAP
ncbi:uncharacterized protein cep295 [Xenentodon cancila]